MVFRKDMQEYDQNVGCVHENFIVKPIIYIIYTIHSFVFYFKYCEFKFLSVLDPLELELQGVVSCPMWMIGNQTPVLHK